MFVEIFACVMVIIIIIIVLLVSLWVITNLIDCYSKRDWEAFCWILLVVGLVGLFFLAMIEKSLAV